MRRYNFWNVTEFWNRKRDWFICVEFCESSWRDNWMQNGHFNCAMESRGLFYVAYRFQMYVVWWCTLITLFHELNVNFLMQVGLDKLFDSDMNLIITVWRRLELFSTHSFRHEVGIYFHQLFDSVLCLICIFCNIDRKSVDLFQPKIPENSILFKIIIRSWWATKSISKVQSMLCFIVLWRFKLQVDKVFFFIFRSCTTHLGNCRKLFNLKQSIDVLFHHPDFRNLSSSIINQFEISGPGYYHQKQPSRSGKLIEIVESIKALNCLIG